jgi:hypothetical protein
LAQLNSALSLAQLPTHLTPTAADGLVLKDLVLQSNG